MLERIEQIQGIGLLHDANGKPFKWQKATLIYGDNGRGKSTLASILHSASTGDPSLITARATVDGSKAPATTLQFENGHKVSFAAGKWSEKRPELVVFDPDFIEKNVYSGGVVSTGHRKNLLEFALGEKAVTARAQEDQATNEAKLASEAIQRLTQQLSGHHAGISLAAFEALAEIPNVDQQIEEAQKRVAAANNIASIVKRAVPAVVGVPFLDFNAIFTLLRTTIENVQENAEATVRAHVARLSSPSAESWLSQGSRFDDGKTCPYCAQPTEGVDLIRAYRTHFNAAYAELKEKVAQLDKTVAEATAGTKVDSFAQELSTANAKAAAWEDHVPITPAAFDSAFVATKLQELQAQLLDLVRRKQANPTLAVGTEQEQAKAEKAWTEVLQLMEAANATISKTIGDIDTFRQNLATENVQQLQLRVQQLQLAKRRHTPQTKSLIEQLVAARSESATAKERKRVARENLDNLMQQTLKTYQRDINILLKKFGASFTIEKMNANFLGSAPRSEYGLALRGKSIPLEGGPPSFSTTMSEGDKRTLALAFFVASTLADPKLKDCVVVMDDPMCSLDLNRKQHTRTVLQQIHAAAAQTVVLAHDPFFIRDMRDTIIAEDSSSQVAVFQIQRELNDYTNFGNIDVDRECESPYFRHHRLLSDFATNGTGDPAHVAKAIRPLLEGYLHRRFPGLIPQGLLFGQVVAYIGAAQPPNPVCFAQALLPELNEINKYAGQFHHDTNPGKADTVVIVPSELRTYAQRALEVVYKGTP